MPWSETSAPPPFQGAMTKMPVPGKFDLREVARGLIRRTLDRGIESVERRGHAGLPCAGAVHPDEGAIGPLLVLGSLKCFARWRYAQRGDRCDIPPSGTA
jgi:hypothetical protein